MMIVIYSFYLYFSLFCINSLISLDTTDFPKPRHHDANSGPILFWNNEIELHEWKYKILKLKELYHNGTWINAWLYKENFLPLYSINCHYIYLAECPLSNYNLGEYWIWKSTSKYYNWDVSHFCKIMNGRNLLLIGDSLTQQLYVTIWSTFYSRVILKKGMTIEDIEKERELLYTSCKASYCWHEQLYAPCNGKFQVNCGDDPSFFVHYLQTDYLQSDARDSSYSNYILDNNISIVLLNTGAHFNENAKDNVNATLWNIFQNNPNISVIFRNTVPGHGFCPDLFTSSPLKSPQNLSDELYAKYHKYHWQYFHQINTDIEILLRDVYPQVIYMDVATSGVLRADSHIGLNHPHIDCLHYCTPGPIDNWFRLFYQTIIIATDMIPKYDIDSSMTYNLRIEPPEIKEIIQDNDVIKCKETSRMYLYKNHTKFPFYNTNAFISQGRHWNEIKVIPTKLLFEIPLGKPIY